MSKIDTDCWCYGVGCDWCILGYMDRIVLELQAAMGGDDAAKFVTELRRAYLRFGQRKG